MTTDSEREAVVAWLRADADRTEIESQRIVTNSHGLTIRDINDWKQLIGTQRDIADAIERGDHMKGQTP